MAVGCRWILIAELSSWPALYLIVPWLEFTGGADILFALLFLLFHLVMIPAAIFSAYYLLMDWLLTPRPTATGALIEPSDEGPAPSIGDEIGC